MPQNKLILANAIYDSPKTQAALSVFEEDATLLRKFTQDFQSSCEKIQMAQQELASATRGLANLMKTYMAIKFPMEQRDSCMMTTFPMLADYMDQMSSMQEAVASQISTAMVTPISRFISADLEELSQLQNLYRLISDEHEMSVQRYCKLSQRCGELERCDAIDEVFHMRKKLHRTALHYFSSMNLVQRKRQFVFLESLASHMQAHLGLIKAGAEYVDKQELDTLYGTTRGLLLCGHRELDLERANATNTVASLEACYDESNFLPEPLAPTTPQPPPIGQAAAGPQVFRKSGYLMQRCRPGPPGLASRWDRMFFSVKQGRLMRQTRRPPQLPSVAEGSSASVAGVCLLDLRRPTAAAAAPADADDRRHVFAVISPSISAPLFLQAESASERATWLAVINAAAASAGESSVAEDSGDESDEQNSSAASGDEETGNKADGDEDNYEQLLLGGSERSVALLSEDARSVAGAAYSRIFSVRLIGSCQVDALAAETPTDAVLRMAATTSRRQPTVGGERLLLAVSDQGVWLVEPASRLTRCRVQLSRTRIWPASRRLLGLSTAEPTTGRRRQERQRQRFACLALRLGDGRYEGEAEEEEGTTGGESAATADAVCAALSAAQRSAAAGGSANGGRETALLLANIDRLPDVISDADAADPPPPTPPPRRPPATADPSEDDRGSGGGGEGVEEDESMA